MAQNDAVHADLLSVQCFFELFDARLLELFLLGEPIAPDDVFLMAQLHELHGDASLLDRLTHAQAHQHVLPPLLLPSPQWKPTTTAINDL